MVGRIPPIGALRGTSPLFLAFTGTYQGMGGIVLISDFIEDGGRKRGQTWVRPYPFVLSPMAASLSFGIMTSTVLVLILVPSFYCIMDILFKIGPRPEKSPVTEPAIAEPAIAG